MSTERRLVSVTALVETDKTQGPQDIAASYAAVAVAMTGLAERRMNGDDASLVLIAYPLLRFEARSEPLPEGSPEPTAGQLRALLDEATRELAVMRSPAYYVSSLREQAGLERL